MPLDLDKFSYGEVASDARALLHVANHQSNVGQFDAAKATLERAKQVARKGLVIDLDLALSSTLVGLSLVMWWPSYG